MAVTKAFHDFFCPECQVPVKRVGEDAYNCDLCSRIFPFYAGIPDFRLEGMGEEEWRETEQLLRNFDRCSFMELIAVGGSGSTPHDLVELDRKYEERNVLRGEERIFSVSKLTGRPVGGDMCLDIGCGTAGALVPLAASFKRGIGLDIAMTDLILAKKLFEENGIENVTLVCSGAEHLPFGPNTFDLINSTDVIEHVQDQRRFLSEGHRVMVKGGAFCYNTPNRFSMFGEEPHVKLWGVGFLPRKLMGKYVKLRKGIDWYDANVRLLSRRELGKMMGELPDTRFEIHGPIFDTANADWSFKRRLVSRFPIMLDIANTALKPIVPSFQVVMFKEANSVIAAKSKKSPTATNGRATKTEAVGRSGR